jgi:hypothetical protein
MARATLLTLVLGLISAASASSNADAQELLFADRYEANLTYSLPEIGDRIYDYDVYASEQQEWAWWVQYFAPYGGTFLYEKGPFYSEAAAQRYLRWYPPRYGRAEIVRHLTPLDFVFVERFDTYAEAADFASLLQSLGLVTDVRRVSDIVFVNDDPILSAGF